MNTTQAPDETGADSAILLLEETRTALATLALPLELPAANAAHQRASDAVRQLDDYILPRYRSLDAPLLAVVGGSTGAGKSTLVNAIVGRPVSRSGAIRPTTRQPILLHHPADAAWFTTDRILPGLSRITGHAIEDASQGSLVLLSADSIPRGIALLDAPDIDSVADENRRLAGQLLAAADLWVFVTTANRYADAVPWKLLAEAAEREITLAIVLDRVPPRVEDEITGDLRRMLQAQDLGTAEMFVIPESRLDERHMLPNGTADAVRRWLEGIAADAAGRSAIARRTLQGVVRRLAGTVEETAAAQGLQLDAGALLHAQVADAYDQAAARIHEATRDGTLLRGEVLARWQDFVGTGEFFRSLESSIGRLRDRIGAFFSGKPQPIAPVERAIESGLHAVIVDQAAKAAEQVEARWRAEPAAARLMGARDMGSVSPEFSDAVAAGIRAWQGELMEIIRAEGAGKRVTARMVSFGINGVAVALMIVVFASTAGLTGLEVGIAGGSAIVGQKLLEAIFGEDAVRRLAARARKDLDQRCQQLLAGESARFLELLHVLPQSGDVARLADLADRLAGLAWGGGRR